MPKAAINVKCVVCGKSRQAHFDMIYCYAATKYIAANNTSYVFPIKDFKFKPEETNEAK